MFDLAQVRERIVEAATVEAELSSATANDVAFHLTDWLADLSVFVRFCEEPGVYSPAQINELLLAFLAHVPNHVAAAAKLYADLPVSDIFGVGSVSGGAEHDA